VSTHKLARYLRLKAAASKSKIFASKKEKEENWIRQYKTEFPPLLKTSPEPTREYMIKFMRARGQARYEDHVRREEEEAQRNKKEEEEKEEEEKQAKKLAREKEREDNHVQEMQSVCEGLTFYIWYQIVRDTEQDCPTASRMRDKDDELRREEEEERYWREVSKERDERKKAEKDEQERAEKEQASEAILRDPSSSEEAKEKAQQVLDQMEEDEEYDAAVFEYQGLRYGLSLEKKWRVQAEESQLLEKRLTQWHKMNETRPEWRRWKWNK
jgi:hypothetical protein